ncbi:MAG: hypothetical protein ABDH19_00020 [Thermodesulfovibrio sp.]
MEKETFISKSEGLYSDDSEPNPSDHSEFHHSGYSEPKSKNQLIHELNKIADYVREKYNANIWFVEIMGKRHSYIAGHKEDSFLPPEVIYISERYAVVSNQWDEIKEKDEIIKKIKMLFFEGTKNDNT